VEAKGSCGEDVFSSSARSCLSAVDHREISQSFRCSSVCNASRAEVLLFPTRACKRSPNKDEQDVCPGYDANEEAPIGCFFIKGILVNMGVTHQ